MGIYEITFSPTGGTQKVADTFTKAFTNIIGKESGNLNLLDSQVKWETIFFTSEDFCIVAVPSFGGRVPTVAISRLRQMKGGGAKAVLIAVYGNRAYNDTLLELQETLTEAGFSCVAALAAVAEHSIMHQFATGRPDAKDCREIATFATQVGEKIARGTISENLALPGNRPYQSYGGVPIKPKAGKSCKKCSICAIKCPVGAISVADPSQTDTAICISCMGCIAVCPTKARSVNKVVVAAAGQKMKKACKDPKKNELFCQ